MAQTQTLSALHIGREKLMVAARAIGHFFYGDDKRTRYSCAFAFVCISLYLVAVINASASCYR